MPKANADPNTSPEPADERGRVDAQQPEPAETAAVSRWPLGDIEPELQGLRTVASLLGHVAHSPHQIEDADLSYIESQIVAHHERLKALWRQAWEERKQEREEHEAELAAAKAHTAQGSRDEVEHVAGLWGLLAATADVVLKEARKALPEGARALLGEAKAPLPAESGEA